MLTTGQKIKKLRKSKGLTQERFAESLQIDWRLVSKWERDVCLPSGENISRIAKCFGGNAVSYIFSCVHGGDENE